MREDMPEGSPVAISIERSLERVHHDNDELIEEFVIGEVGVIALGTALGFALKHLRDTKETAKVHTREALNLYARLADETGAYDASITSYSNPNTVAYQGSVKMTKASMFALHYLDLMEHGVGDQLPGISPNALKAADSIIDISQTDPTFKAGLAVFTAQIIDTERVREQREKGQTIAAPTDAVHEAIAKAKLALSSIEEHSFLQSDVAQNVLHATGVVGGTVVGSNPVTGTAMKQGRRIIAGLTQNEAATVNYINALVDDHLKDTFGPEYERGDEQTIMASLRAFKILPSPVRDVIPEDVDLDELKRALAVRFIRRNVADVMDPNTADPIFRQIATSAAIASALDWYQATETSYTGAWEMMQQASKRTSPAEQTPEH